MRALKNNSNSPLGANPRLKSGRVGGMENALRIFHKYSFRKYLKKYPKLYQLERKRIRKILPSAQIAHCGSTAVPGLGGKGIVDIIIAVPRKYRLDARKKLEKAGYTFKESGGDAERFFLRRDYNYNSKIRRVHLHLTWHNSPNWKKTLSVVWYLKRNPVVAEEYAKLKKNAVQFAKSDGEKYRKYKGTYLRVLTKKALKEHLTHKTAVH